MSLFSHQLVNASRLLLLIALTLVTVSWTPSICHGQEPELGSRATLEQIQNRFSNEPSVTTVPSVPRDEDLVTSPASAPELKLEYRFWPDERSLKPGSGILHLDRALFLYQSLGPIALNAWNEYQVSLDRNNPDPRDLTQRLEPFELVYAELDRFAVCEDQSWDLRMRDLKGVELYGYLLPEVQQYRDLARLLRFRALEQLGRRDFAGAVATIRIGYRLAAFLRQGEMLIQQLIAVAVEGIMQETIEDAIRTPGCPNLYHALATIQHDRRSFLRAIEIELSGIERAIPVLNQPEEILWDQDTWKKEWSKSAESFSQLSGVFSNNEGILRGAKAGLNLLLATELASDAREARQRLIQSGLAKEKVAKMYPEQVVAIDAAQQLRKSANELLAACLQPYPAAKDAIGRVNQRLSQQANRVGAKSLATTLAGTIMPAQAIETALNAELRLISTHNRLLTIEAVRHFAATHAGQLPKTLTELTDLPPHIDLHTGELIGFEVKTGAEGEFAEFLIRSQNDSSRIRRLSFRK